MWNRLTSFFVCFFCYFRGVQDFLNHEHRVFNSEEFLRTREPADQLFYKKVCMHLKICKHTHTHKTLSAACLSSFSSPGIRHSHLPLIPARQAEPEMGHLQPHGAEHTRQCTQVWCNNGGTAVTRSLSLHRVHRVQAKWNYQRPAVSVAKLAAQLPFWACYSIFLSITE